MDTCPTCNNEYKRLGMHWAMKEECIPTLTKHKKDIILGLLMSDGNIVQVNHSKNAYFMVSMITKEYLEYIDDKLSYLSNGVKLVTTAEESARQKRESGFRPNANKENYNDIYRITTKTHPYFTELRKWYSTGKKVWDYNIDLNPTVLKHLYCGDGTLHQKRSISIAAANEIDRQNEITEKFKKASYPVSNFNISKRKNGSKSMDILFNVKTSEKMFNDMGSPPPGFEYKWPEEYY